MNFLKKLFEKLLDIFTELTKEFGLFEAVIAISYLALLFTGLYVVVKLIFRFLDDRQKEIDRMATELREYKDIVFSLKGLTPGAIAKIRPPDDNKKTKRRSKKGG